ncbi:hypothetical protein AX774_g5158 [Zancudomyces culisetae]|uniref:Uncharacterized protein n=1 Tax=Zancudomyces culisetae TaxID=1213189 RepID=A0A1R1PK92_ZANCU|nr:hypothetical protein AX774_g5158 [Zancudomyces culisetae]|eukprot:OMH81385.1 hypothetical protein AX774_g5158 [Zancudomyces culisetae]
MLRMMSFNMDLHWHDLQNAFFGPQKQNNTQKQALLQMDGGAWWCREYLHNDHSQFSWIRCGFGWNEVDDCQDIFKRRAFVRFDFLYTFYISCSRYARVQRIREKNQVQQRDECTQEMTHLSKRAVNLINPTLTSIGTSMKSIHRALEFLLNLEYRHVQ